MSTKVLGKKISYRGSKDLKILDKIKRSHSNIKYGIDIWNVYDFLFLDNKNLPILKVLEISFPITSKYIVESKSMKLYLNNFYNKSFNKESELINIIKNDIEKIIQSPIKIKFINKFYNEPNYQNLNTVLNKKSGANTILKFNGFRSICPVTAQPDLANIYIYSDKQFSINWLRDYLTSYQNQGDFHEQCIESIYTDIKSKFLCSHLEVCGRFQRRGGIDINPIRGNKKDILFKNFREFNQ